VIPVPATRAGGCLFAVVRIVGGAVFGVVARIRCRLAGGHVRHEIDGLCVRCYDPMGADVDPDEEAA
jgi:hypothetical protein